MTTVVYDITRYSNAVHNWWIYLLLGLVFGAMGVVVFTRPGESYLALSFAFGVMVLLSGFMEVYLGLMTPARAGRGWMIAGGGIEILLGLLMFYTPAALLLYLPFLLGFWLMFKGFNMVGISVDMISYGLKGASLTLALAVLQIIFSLMVIANPVLGIGVTVTWLALALLTAGASFIVHSLRLGRMKRSIVVEDEPPAGT